MSNAKRITLAVVVVVVIAGGAIWYKVASSSNDTSADTTPATDTQQTSDDNAAIATTITYNGSGFSLSKSTVASGSTVKIVNDSNSALDFDSDPHPTHTDNPELNQGDITPGTSKAFTVTTKGSWGFHNHNDPTQHGNITVN